MTELATTESPMMFLGESVRNIQADIKTQTRRIVKVPSWLEKMKPNMKKAFPDKAFGVTPCLIVSCADGSQQRLGNPWHWPEPHRIWVKEKWAKEFHSRFHDRHGMSAPDYLVDPETKEPLVIYDADLGFPMMINDEFMAEHDDVAWKSPMMMPRRVSRLTLEVVEVRAERLQQITMADCIAEGVKIPVTTKDCPPGKGRMLLQLTGPGPHGDFAPCKYLPRREALRTEEAFYRAHYASMWDFLNSKRGYSWKSNPWVWVITFRRIQ